MWDITVEWAAEGAAEYDVAALEKPRMSDSAQAAKERQEAATNSHFTLHQCVEVRTTTSRHPL